MTIRNITPNTPNTEYRRKKTSLQKDNLYNYRHSQTAAPAATTTKSKSDIIAWQKRNEELQRNLVTTRKELESAREQTADYTEQAVSAKILCKKLQQNLAAASSPGGPLSSCVSSSFGRTVSGRGRDVSLLLGPHNKLKMIWRTSWIAPW